MMIQFRNVYMSESEEMSARMSDKTACQNICQIDSDRIYRMSQNVWCQIECQMQCQNLCQKECQIDCLKMRVGGDNQSLPLNYRERKDV